MALHLEQNLQRDIDRIREKILDMSGRAEQALSRSLKAFHDRSRQTAYSVILRDQYIDQLEKEIDRQQRELERMQQDAQAELNELQQDLQNDFQRKLMPVLEKMAQEKGLQFLFSGADAGLIWAEPGLDLTDEAVKRLDAAEKAAAGK